MGYRVSGGGGDDCVSDIAVINVCRRLIGPTLDSKSLGEKLLWNLGVFLNRIDFVWTGATQLTVHLWAPAISVNNPARVNGPPVAPPEPHTTRLSLPFGACSDRSAGVIPLLCVCAWEPMPGPRVSRGSSLKPPAAAARSYRPFTIGPRTAAPPAIVMRLWICCRAPPRPNLDRTPGAGYSVLIRPGSSPSRFRARFSGSGS